MSFAKVETRLGDGDWGMYQEGKESRSRHSALEPLWESADGSDQKAAEFAHLKSGDKEHRTHQQRQNNSATGENELS